MSHWILTPTGAFRAWATALMVLLGLGVAVGLTIGYVGKVDRQRTRETCGIVRLIDDRNQRMPPATDKDTADFRTEVHRYRLALGC